MMDDLDSVTDEDLLDIHDELVTFMQENESLVRDEPDLNTVHAIIQSLMRRRDLL